MENVIFWKCAYAKQKGNGIKKQVGDLEQFWKMLNIMYDTQHSKK